MKKKSKWYLNSRYSKYMMSDKEQFTKLEAKDGGCVTFGDNAKGKIVGIGLTFLVLANYVKWVIRSCSTLKIALLVILMMTR